MSIPDAIHGKRYLSLATFRKTGVPVWTPIWFAEDESKLYFMTNAKLGKVKRIRNNPRVKIAPCTISGRITNPLPVLAYCLLKMARAYGAPSKPNTG